MNYNQLWYLASITFVASIMFFAGIRAETKDQKITELMGCYDGCFYYYVEQGSFPINQNQTFDKTDFYKCVNRCYKMIIGSGGGLEDE
ncbi:MAG: hypothetical protein ACOCV1_00210 [Bacillota bacterium]